ncbi:MAG: O-antigen ligase family protein [Patescibacteria group bacterium]
MSLWQILLLLIPIAYLAWRNFPYAVLALIFLLPTYLLRTEIFGLPTTYLELAIYLVSIFAIIRGSYKIILEQYAEYWLWYNFALIFLGTAILGVLIAPDLRLALGIFKGFIIDPFILLSLVIIAGFKSQNLLSWRDKIIVALVASGALSVVIGFILGYIKNQTRLSGFYDSPNVMAMTIVPILLAGTIWFFNQDDFNNKSGWPNKLFIVALIILWLGLWRTSSYMAWLSVLVATVYYQAIKFRFGIQLRKIIIIAVIVLGILLPFSGGLLSSLGVVGHRNEVYQVNSITVREILWHEAALFIKQNPILGLGVGSWQVLFLRDIMPNLPAGRAQGFGVELYYASLYPHNLFITWWLYFGIIGLVVTFGAVGILLWRTVTRKGMLILPSIILLSIVTHGLLDTPVLKNDLFVLFLLSVVGCISSIKILGSQYDKL